MKKLFLVALLLAFFPSSYAKKKTKYKRYEGINLNELVPIDDKSYIYPVYMFLMSFKDDQPYKALDYCTEEAIYNVDNIDTNTYYRFRNQYTFANFSDLSKIRLHITEHWDGKVKIVVSIPLSNKGQSIVKYKKSSRFFYISKKDGQYLINRIN